VEGVNVLCVRTWVAMRFACDSFFFGGMMTIGPASVRCLREGALSWRLRFYYYARLDATISLFGSRVRAIFRAVRFRVARLIS
jgi:hypothetical protein